MLTRLEVDGFKNLLGFVAEFGAFTCIAGANAVGKSNLFDAIEFLSLLARHKLNEAASKIRAVPGATGTGRELFWTNGVDQAQVIEFAAEMIVDGVVTDDFDQVVWPSGRHLRYELKLGYENGQNRRITVIRESLRILADANRIRFPHSSSFAQIEEFKGSPGLVFDTEGGQGFHEGRQPDSSLMPRTIISLPDAVSDRPTALAARDEMASWIKIALDPSAIAAPDDFDAPRSMSTEGRHIPSILLARARHEGEHIAVQFSEEEEVYAEVAMRLSEITPVRKIWVESDEDRGTRSLRIELRTGEVLPARALSAGTLRFLALIVLAQTRAGLICLEEPENGMHPFQVREVLEILEDLSIDPEGEFEPEEGALKLKQVIINTHSPPLVKKVYERQAGDILLATNATIARAGGRAEVLRLHPLLGTWRCSEDVRGIGPLLLAPYVGSGIHTREP